MIDPASFTHHRAPYREAGASMRAVLMRANAMPPPLAGSNTPNEWSPTPPLSAAHLEDREVFSERTETNCALERDRIAVRLADNLKRFSYDKWLEVVDALRREGVGDVVIDESAG